MNNFDSAFSIVIGLEGCYVNDPADPGGETKYGISKRRYPSEDIPNLTLDRAKALYRQDYWVPHLCDSMPWPEALLVFDTAVNGGHPKLWHALHAGSPDFIIEYQADHLLYLASLPNWPHAGLGWTRRALRISLAAARDL